MTKGCSALMILVMMATKVIAQQPAETIPAFEFFTHDKIAFTEKNITPGKLVMFIFFDAACDHCQHAILYLDQHIREFEKAAIYLVTLDSRETTSGFMNKYGAHLKSKKYVTILQDTRSEFLRKFRPKKYPSLFLYSSLKKLILYDDNEQNMPMFSKKINDS